MRIEHIMTYNELNRLGGDDRLVPVLRQKGMPVYFSPRGIATSNGTFGWHDRHSTRTFWWEGTTPVGSANERACSCGNTALVLENDVLRCTVCQRTFDLDFLRPVQKESQMEEIETGPDQRNITFDE